MLPPEAAYGTSCAAWDQAGSSDQPDQPDMNILLKTSFNDLTSCQTNAAWEYFFTGYLHLFSIGMHRQSQIFSIRIVANQ